MGVGCTQRALVTNMREGSALPLHSVPTGSRWGSVSGSTVPREGVGKKNLEWPIGQDDPKPYFDSVLGAKL